MNTIDNNKLIARFMGREVHTDDISWFDENFKPLKYDDWNTIMSVVEKINHLNMEGHEFNSFEVVIKMQDTSITALYRTSPHERAYKLGYRVSACECFLSYGSEEDTLLNNTYKTIVEFIKWYNKETKTS